MRNKNNAIHIVRSSKGTGRRTSTNRIDMWRLLKSTIYSSVCSKQQALEQNVGTQGGSENPAHQKRHYASSHEIMQLDF